MFHRVVQLTQPVSSSAHQCPCPKTIRSTACNAHLTPPARPWLPQVMSALNSFYDPVEAQEMDPWAYWDGYQYGDSYEYASIYE